MADELAISGRTDADYFAAVDEFLRKQSDLEEVDERRRSRRYDYRTEAMIAFCPEDQVPPINWFESFHCRDLSRGGFSFFSPDEPPLEHLIVIFRRETDYLCLAAHVVYTGECEHGASTYIVGCEFLHRVMFEQGSVRRS